MSKKTLKDLDREALESERSTRRNLEYRIARNCIIALVEGDFTVNFMYKGIKEPAIELLKRTDNAFSKEFELKAIEFFEKASKEQKGNYDKPV